jgi:hypothetical protein
MNRTLMKIPLLDLRKANDSLQIRIEHGSAPGRAHTNASNAEKNGDSCREIGARRSTKSGVESLTGPKEAFTLIVCIVTFGP